ncbi:hypothetical protein O3P69_012126 [Scylla paramamosain]|uniref:Uncharacterized protein n=2 Tax=Scylla paramamosain TaxID=85552 RepID=A0AAW0TBT7_SCYPA
MLLLDPFLISTTFTPSCWHWVGLALLLLQLECSLRCLFAWANKVPSQVITAQHTALYTTIDHALAAPVTGGRAGGAEGGGEVQIEERREESGMTEGTRKDDADETEEAEIKDDKHKKKIAFESSNKGMESIKHPILPHPPLLSSTRLSQETENALQVLRRWISGYRSHYHPTSLLHEALLSSTSLLGGWKEWKRVERSEMDYVE